MNTVLLVLSASCARIVISQAVLCCYQTEIESYINGHLQLPLSAEVIWSCANMYFSHMFGSFSCVCYYNKIRPILAFMYHADQDFPEGGRSLLPITVNSL